MTQEATADDRAVFETLQRYGSLLDTGRFDEWIDLFSDDAVCGSGPAVYAGRPAIDKWIRGKTAFGQHAIATPMLYYAMDGATVTAVTPFAHVMTDDAGNGRLERAGRYFTRLRRNGNGDSHGWIIIEHIIDFHVHD